MSLIVSWHPTYAFFHNPYEMGTFMVDLDRFARMIRGKLEPGPRRIQIHPTSKTIAYFHKKALKRGRIFVDVETVPSIPGDEYRYTGKQSTRAKLQLVGLGFDDEALSFRWEGFGRPIERATKKLLADKRIVKVFHNGFFFDLIVLGRHDIPVAEPIEDTRDQRRALSSTSPLSLAYTGSLHTDYPPWKEGEGDDVKGLVFTKNLKKKKRYNGHDCIVTARVDRGNRAEPEWNSKRVQRLYEHQMQLSRIAAEMHVTGLPVNPVLRKFLAWGLRKEFNQRARHLKRVVNVDGFECTPNHLRALIYKKHATGKYAHLAKFDLDDPLDPEMYAKPKEMTTIAVNERGLTLLLIDPSLPKELREIIQLYWDAQSVAKQRSFVVSKKLTQAIGRDGRLHPSWNSCGTDTGRFSCSDPNVMQVDELLRAMYEETEGWVIVGGDYKSMELRVMAAVAKDDALAAALATEDVYTAEAIEYFHLPPDTTKKTIKKDARQLSKIIRLSRQYGAGTKKGFQIALTLDRTITYDKFAPVMNAFDRRNWRTVKYWEEETERVLQCGYSESRIMNRRRVYPREPDRPDIANYPIQSTAADIKNLALIDVWKRLKKEVPEAKIIIDLHDAIYVRSPEKKAKKVQRIMRDCMEVEHTIDGDTYHFPVDFKISQAWG